MSVVPSVLDSNREYKQDEGKQLPETARSVVVV